MCYFNTERVIWCVALPEIVIRLRSIIEVGTFTDVLG